MKKYKLPKEFAEKWLTALRSGEYQQGDEQLLSYGDKELEDESDFPEVDEENKSYCCLGVACSLTEVPERVYSGETFVSEDQNVDTVYMLEEGYPGELVGEEGLPYFLSLLNDGTMVDEYFVTNYLSEVHLRKPYLLGETYQLNFSEIADFIEDNVEFY